MSTPKTIAFHTLGCKLNFSETSSIKRQFEEAGFGVQSFDANADYYVLNTCSVTDFADKKCRYEVRKAKKHNPNAKVIIIGCYAQLKPKEISEIDGVDLVLGASEKFNILQHIQSLDNLDNVDVVRSSQITEVNSFIDAFSFGDRTRSFLKVQDGCNYKCSFCTIPLARGKSRSDTIENVVNNAKKIADLGVKEIVLTGVNIGDFGNGTEVIEGLKPKKEALFIDLIRALDNVEGISRFRISSIEPNLCNEEIIDFVAQSNRFMPHFHMPLQSGSNEMLKQMRRRYKRELYAERVTYIKRVMPHCCIGVDVIVGFPGETEAHFLETYNFLKDLDVSYLHVFTYSERDNTFAAELPNVVPMGTRKERNKMLRILSEKKKRAFYNQHIGSSRSVLFEAKQNEGLVSGFTDNYIKVEGAWNKDVVNTLDSVALTSISENGSVIFN
ncbi:MAG: tRNA (N(6)-L-threonylcarbamoyladenosine(37)-C(2))-methylthiotransferase MtaB [Bacteroidia bacterium]|nr:tRNA (N(6)-L-threonylcarbamoyladenosine(37)-C(2))-methylthiotransferase MtaB [Bacteroidia bacterium]